MKFNKAHGKPSNPLDMRDVQADLREVGLGHILGLERRYETAVHFQKHTEAKLLKNRLDSEWDKLRPVTKQKG